MKRFDQLVREVTMGPKTRSATEAEQKWSGEATKDTTKQESKGDMLNSRKRVTLEHLEFMAQNLQTAINEQPIHIERTKILPETLENSFEAFMLIIQVIMACSNKDDRAQEQKFLIKVQMNTLEIIARANQRLHSQQTTPQSSVQIPTMSTKLPDLKLTKFTGSYASFPAWWAQFVSNVDTRQDLDEVAKLTYLWQFTAGDAYQAISALTVTPNNYSAVKTVMQDQFGKDSLVVMAIIHDVGKMPLPLFKSSASTGKTLADIQGHMQTLKNLGCQVDEKSMSFISRAIIQDKIKFKHCDTWCMYELSKGKQYQATITEYLNFIQAQIASKWEAQGENKEKGNPQQHQQQATALAEQHQTKDNAKNSLTGQKHPCFLCKGEHHPTQCQETQKRTVDEC